VTSAQELGRDRLSAAEQLRYAAAEGRILVTKDDEDLINLTGRFLAAGSLHAGLLIVNRRVSRVEFGLFVEALLRFVEERELPLQPYEIAWLKRPWAAPTDGLRKTLRASTGLRRRCAARSLLETRASS